MCKKVDKLLNRFENEISNSEFDIRELCADINRHDLNDENMIRIARVLYQNQKWYWLVTLIFMVVIFYAIFSIVLSVIFTTILIVLYLILPMTLSITITLSLLMMSLSFIQCK